VVVRNGFLEVVGCTERGRPRAQTDCPVGNKLLVFPTDSIAKISARRKGEENSHQIISEASTETAGSEREASAPLTARSSASSDAVWQPPAVVASEQVHPWMIFVPAFYNGASPIPAYQGEHWAAPPYAMQVSSVGPQMQQMPAQEHHTHPSVPASRAASAPSASAPRRAPTTMMLRNLPTEYERAALLELLDAEGFAGLYDFVYLPSDFRRSGCFGYSFINFVTPAVAHNFRQHFQGFGRWAVPSDRVAEVSVSDPLQGLRAHIERYRDSPLMHASVPDGYKPVLLANGMRIPFPPPTKKLKAPRMRPAKDSETT